MTTRWSEGTECWLARLAESSKAAGTRENTTSLFDTANPQPNPQKVMSCMTSACLGSPRVVVSRCKTDER